MEDALGLVVLTLAALAATSVDNLLLLVGFAARPGQSRASILRGGLLAMTTLLAGCVLAAFLADVAPQRWLGYLGIVPIALGIRELAAQANAREGETAVSPEPPPTRSVRSREIAAVMLANSSDSLAALIPVFAETRNRLLPVISGVMLMAALAACYAAFSLASNPRLGPPLQRIGTRMVPFVLIAVGLYVLWNTGTDTAR